MKIISWNERGLRSKKKRRVIKDLLCEVRCYSQLTKRNKKKKKKERKSVIGTWCEAFDWLGIESG